MLLNPIPPELLSFGVKPAAVIHHPDADNPPRQRTPRPVSFWHTECFRELLSASVMIR